MLRYIYIITLLLINLLVGGRASNPSDFKSLDDAIKMIENASTHAKRVIVVRRVNKSIDSGILKDKISKDDIQNKIKELRGSGNKVLYEGLCVFVKKLLLVLRDSQRLIEDINRRDEHINTLEREITNMQKVIENKDLIIRILRRQVNSLLRAVNVLSKDRESLQELIREIDKLYTSYLSDHPIASSSSQS